MFIGYKADWADRFGLNFGAAPRLAIGIPPVHALLLATGTLCTYCIPIKSGPAQNSRGLGMHLLRTVVSVPASALPPLPQAVTGAPITPDFLQSLADSLRSWAPIICQRSPESEQQDFHECLT